MAPRTRQPVPWRFVATGLVATTVLLVVVVIYGYVRFIRYERVAVAHVPADSTAAIVVQVERITLFDPVRKQLLPLLDDVAKPAGEGRLAALRKQGLNLGFDLREVAAARGQGAADWVVVLSGKFPRQGAVAMIATVLQGEGPAAGWSLSEDRATLVGPRGLAIGQADDGAIIFASSATELAAALPAGDAWRGLGLSNETAASFYVSGALARKAARSAGGSDPGDLASVVGQADLRKDVLQGTVQIGLPKGRDPGQALTALRVTLASLGRSPLMASAGQTSTLQKAEVRRAGDGVAVRLAWQGADLGQAATALGNAIRGWTGTPLPRAGPANP